MRAGTSSLGRPRATAWTDPALAPRRTAVAPGGLNCLPDGLPAHPKKDDVRTVFVYLQGSKDVLKDRMRNRKGHYMKEEVRSCLR